MWSEVMEDGYRASRDSFPSRMMGVGAGPNHAVTYARKKSTCLCTSSGVYEFAHVITFSKYESSRNAHRPGESDGYESADLSSNLGRAAGGGVSRSIIDLDCPRVDRTMIDALIASAR